MAGRTRAEQNSEASWVAGCCDVWSYRSALTAVSRTSKIQLTFLVLTCRRKAPRHDTSGRYCCSMFFTYRYSWLLLLNENGGLKAGRTSEFWSPEICPSQSEKRTFEWTDSYAPKLVRFPWWLEMALCNYRLIFSALKFQLQCFF